MALASLQCSGKDNNIFHFSREELNGWKSDDKSTVGNSGS
jgi:hypothetical protein